MTDPLLHRVRTRGRDVVANAKVIQRAGFYKTAPDVAVNRADS